MSGTPPYVELHAHSAYSFLDGASLPDELIERAAELGHSALAITDHDSLSGAMEFAMAARSSPVRAIVGAEVTVGMPGTRGGARGDDDGGGGGDDGSGGGSIRSSNNRGSASNNSEDEGLRHLTLLVRDGRGWRNLCRLLTLAHSHTRERPDRSAGQPSVALERVLEHADGLVCLTGCAERSAIGRGLGDEATAGALLEAFGKDALRVELQRLYARGDRRRNRELERLARRLDIRTVATGNVHAHTPMRAFLQDALVAVRNGLTLDASEPQRRPNHSHVLARPQAMAARLRDHPEAVAESVRLAETLSFQLTSDLGYRYPMSESTRATRELAEVCEALFASRYPAGYRRRHEAAARLEQELRVIDSLGLSGFFLIHHEILELAQDAAREIRGADTARALLPPGRGRGSSVSSIVCYLTGLSHIDPIAGELALGRFLHEDVVGLPDIDIDFPRDIRAELIARIPRHYGQDRAALVAAFPTYRARGAIRDLGKALGLPAGEIERVARGSEGWGGRGVVSEDIEVALGAGGLRAGGRWQWLTRLADEAQGLPRHLSQHSGGMVISTRPLIDCCPIVPAAMAERQIVQWDKDSCADAGFLKIDLLGLGMLSAVERCVELIARTRGERVDLSRIPFDDRATFAMIQEADTTGVFQIESRAQMGSLRRTRPASLQDLTVQVALVRPGPIVGGAVNPYIERRQALLRDPNHPIPFPHPSLAQALRETLGTIIFQDQVIDVARAFAGFTAGEAEGLRRAMSRKRSQEAMDGHRQRFVQGARQTHPDADEETIERVWSMVAGFAGFGFPKSHGAAFGLLAYQSTWLRVHYTEEFLCALLNEQPMGFYPPDSLIHEAQRRGLAVLAPEINHSEAECSVTEEGALQIGLSYIKGVGAQEIERLVRSREQSGPFRDLQDLAARAGVGHATLSHLAWSGACDALAGGERRHARRTALWSLGVAAPGVHDDTGLQLALDLPLPRAPRLPALGEWDALLADYSTTGVSVERHPIELLRPALTARGARSTGELITTPHGARVTVGGLVIARQRPGTANGITFLLLEDEHGTLNVIVARRLYEADRATVRTQPLIIVEGRFERHADGGGAVNLLAASIAPLLQPSAEEAASVHDLRRPSPPPAAANEDFALVAPPAMNFGQGRRR
ncbi:MAG TPA: error-prone DNA polymerase [Solirubrobacteraceae bacterium]|jgi:error-prone DNA polymerase